ncbi:MAG TPA: SRPBCC family protein [Flavisolibacter sp.]|nr:SRPBCC family protein [Flavisolibacter sp.]
METANKTRITVEANINAPIQKVWDYWTKPEHITQWNAASEDWHTPWAENELKVGGKFKARMEAKDGSFGFDFEGTYNEVQEQKYLEYTIADGRKVQVSFSSQGEATQVVETFEAEDTHSIEMQKEGWQAIMDNFKKYAESK